MILKAVPICLFVVFTGGSAFAQAPSYTMEDVTACSNDAMRLCRDRLPDLEAIQECMKANYDRLRPACKARFDREH